MLISTHYFYLRGRFQVGERVAPSPATHRLSRSSSAKPWRSFMVSVLPKALSNFIFPFELALFSPDGLYTYFQADFYLATSCPLPISLGPLISYSFLMGPLTSFVCEFHQCPLYSFTNYQD